MRILLFFLIIAGNIFFPGFSADAKADNEFFNKEKYHKAADGFHYKDPKPFKEEISKKYTPRNDDWMKFLAYFFAIAAAVFLIYKLVQYVYSPDNRRLKHAEIPTEKTEEEPTIESDLDLLLKTALQENNYRNAIRIYYLMVIRDLNNRNIVQYTIDKTNFDYLSETGSHPVFNVFRELTMTFERIWFGDAFADENNLRKYISSYNDMSTIISLPASKSSSE
jgi:hypothetical protein